MVRLHNFLQQAGYSVEPDIWLTNFVYAERLYLPDIRSNLTTVSPGNRCNSVLDVVCLCTTS